MTEIFNHALRIARIYGTVIVRLDINFSYLTQEYTGHLILDDGREFDLVERVHVMTKEEQDNG